MELWNDVVHLVIEYDPVIGCAVVVAVPVDGAGLRAVVARDGYLPAGRAAVLHCYAAPHGVRNGLLLVSGRLRRQLHGDLLLYVVFGGSCSSGVDVGAVVRGHTESF